MRAKPTGHSRKSGAFSIHRGRLLIICAASGWLGVPSGVIGQTGDPASPARIATDEVLRRQQQLKSAQQLIDAGSLAQTDRSYGEAMDRFRAAFEVLPDAPAVEATRKAVFRRYQSATVQYAQQMIDGARWPQAKYVLEEALKLGDSAGMGSSMDPGIKRMLANLNDPDYYATEISPQHLKNVQRVKELLLLGQGYLDYGDFDRAAKTFNQVLTIDRYNSAARRGIENVERHRMNYYEVARDQTRATKLREIAEGWELPIPRAYGADSFIDPKAPQAGRRQSLEEKLKTIVIPSLEFADARLSDVLTLLNQRSVELDFAEANPSLKGINLVLDTGSFAAGENPGDRTLSIRLSNVPLEIALKYVTQKTGTTFHVDDFAVRIVSGTTGAQSALENRTWIVPPGFLSRGGADNNNQLNNDPFAAPVNQGSGTVVARKTAQEFLEESGVTFGPGTVATYNPASSTLLVRNTADQIALIDGLVQSAREGVNKMVEISLKLLSISQESAKQLGVEAFLGQSNLGSTPRVFAGGGTPGTTTPGPTPFVNPGTGAPVGVFPISSGLRTGDFSTVQTLDDAINRNLGTPQTTNAPAVFSVAGVFTDPQFQAVLRMFSQSKGTDFLCDTKVLVRPGQRGKVELVREFIYPTEYDPPEIPNSVGGGGGGGSAPIVPAMPTAFEMRPVGKIIEVEPTVSEDNHTVGLNVMVDFTDFSGFVNYGTPIFDVSTPLRLGINPITPLVIPNPILMPVFDVGLEVTNLSLWDGQTVVIGGSSGHSVTDSEDKIPFLGDLPGVGRLFRSATEDHTKRGLLIFATVRLIDPGGLPINGAGQKDEANEFPPRFTPPSRPTATSFAPQPFPYDK